MPTSIDLTSWKRRAHYEHFLAYTNPWFHITAEVDVTALKSSPHSLGLGILWAAGFASNAVPALALRLRPDGVVRHDRLDVGCTLLRDNDTFAFAYLHWQDDFERFVDEARVAQSEAIAQDTLVEDDARDDLVYTSILPWVRFTSVGHAHRLDGRDAIPRIAFGKVTRVGECWVMPANIEAHHALVDGLHLSRWFEALQAGLESLN